LKVVHAASAPKGGASAHRPGGIAFTYLLEGEENAPTNFALMLVHVQDGYHAPRHRHNFDQVRIMLDGAFGFDRGQRQEAGSVGYFTEGLYYTQDGRGPSTTLLLQIGGASGCGYMSNRQLRTSVAALETRGTFHEGVYTHLDAAGRKHNQDGYEAAWEHTFGRTVTYPTPRYEGPVLIAPDAFSWVNDGTQPGVARKPLGTFHERALSMAYWHIAPGARCTLFANEQASAWVVLDGDADIDGTNETLLPRSALHLAIGERVALRARTSPVTLVQFFLPRFDAICAASIEVAT
jgi:hypothetical protein